MRGVEAVSGSADRGDEGRDAGTVYLLSEIPDVDIHDVGAGVEGIVPDGEEDLLARQNLMGMAHEVFEEGELPAGEFDLPLRQPDPVREEVDLEIPRFEGGGVRLVVAPDQSPHPGDELLEGEWLREVVVGPGVEGGDFARDLVAGGEHEDGEAGLPQPDAPEDLVPVHSGEHDVEEDEIQVLLERHPEAVGSVVRAEALVAARRQAPVEHPLDTRLILDDKNSHWLPPLVATDRKYN